MTPPTAAARVWSCRPDPACYRCHQAVTGGQHIHTILMSAQGQRFSQEKARQLIRDYDHLILVCGHYEGVDQRFIDTCVDEEILARRFCTDRRRASGDGGGGRRLPHGPRCTGRRGLLHRRKPLGRSAGIPAVHQAGGLERSACSGYPALRTSRKHRQPGAANRA